MPFKFGNSGVPRNPLTQEEAAMARVLIEAIKRANNSISLAELTRIISKLQPDQLARLLDTITLGRDAITLQQQIMESVNIGGSQAISQIQAIASKLIVGSFVPSKVPVANPESLANMTFVNIPAWARPTSPKAEFNLKFDKTNPNSLKFAQTRAGQLVTSIDALTRESIRRIIHDSFASQVDYQRTAMRVKNVIGLHPQWADAVIKFEAREIQRLLKSGFSEGDAIKAAQKSSTSYADQLKNARATMIARTEIQIAQNQGRYEGWTQADAAGYISPEAQKTWMTAKDERVCPICGPLDGETVPWRNSFSIGILMPVAHPHCRCTAIMVPPEIKK